MLLAIQVYRNCETRKIFGATILDTDTLEMKDLDKNTIVDILKKKVNLTTIELGKNGALKLTDMNPDKKRKWYARSSISYGILTEKFCFILGINKGLISFIASGSKGELLTGQGVTLSDLAFSLKVSLNDLVFFNGYIADDLGDRVIKLYNTRTKTYDIINEISLGIKKKRNNALSKEWDCNIHDINTRGVSLVSIGCKVPKVEATIPSGIYYIGRFKGGANVLNLPSSIESLGTKCFYGLKDLFLLNINEGLKVIPEKCCADSKIERVLIPSSIKEIGEQAFCNCIDLRSPIVTYANYIGKRAFYNTNIGMVCLDGTQTIDVEAFARNNRLKTVKLHKGLTEIESGAFRWCKNIRAITIPTTVRKIGSYAFDGCIKLERVFIPLGSSVRIGQNGIPKNTEIILY